MVLRSFGAVVHESTVTESSTELSFELSSGTYLHSVVDCLEETFGRATMLSCVERDVGASDSVQEATPLAADLSEKEETALRAAYQNGYFAQPRKRSATDIAESLGVAHSTFLRHLREAQQTVFDRFYRSSRSDP